MPKPDPISTTLKTAVVARVLTGATKTLIMKDLEISRRQLNRLFKDKEFNKMLGDANDDVLALAKSKIRRAFATFTDEVTRVIYVKLRDDNSLEAVKIVLKILGFEQEEVVKSQTAIQVILPGKAEKEVPNDPGKK